MPTIVPEDLNQLRAELGALDRELLELVARRQALASSIGELKARLGRPTRDFTQEKEVLERARNTAASVGLSGDLATELLRLLIASSLTRQEQDLLAATGGGLGRRALVIGGNGRMGGWLLRFLSSQGFAVEIADPAPGPAEVPRIADWRESPLDHDLIVLATTLQVSAEILAELAQRRPQGLVFDVGSLKGPLRPSLEALRAAGVRVTSIHPMFGPNTELLSGRHVIFVDCGVPEAIASARALFAPTMAIQVTMSAAEHDRLIGYVLGLSHAVNIAFSAALAGSGQTVPALAQLSSTTFDAQLAVAGQVASENPRLYFEIQSLNQYGLEPLRALKTATDAILESVKRGDEAAFTALMERGRDYFTGRGGEAG
ncbi:MAG TPA: prephenate dehydrogenase/arogenate dehydrogenase family protein [Gemmatimonadales bacterium]|nr:prephenate dehydrogenase/arogenate dehydrogenase family protein [Gemmatimonadales bacterium]